MKHFKSRIQFIVGVIIITVVVVLVGFLFQSQATGDLKVYFLDVGQGDSEYIKTPSGQDILIDGGPDKSVLDELSKVMDFGDREINLVILTHPHADHVTGLVEVLSRFKVDEIWETGVEYPSSTYDAWKKEIADLQIPDKLVVSGDKQEFDKVKILVLYPLSPLENQTINNLNNASVVNRLDFEKFSVLFTGDAEKEVADKLASQPNASQNLHITVLKVNHHGSATGITEDFLRVVRPAVAVIEVGKDNKFGHPAQSTINLLKKYAVRIFMTDQNGTVEISSDGEGYSVKTL